MKKKNFLFLLTLLPIVFSSCSSPVDKIYVDKSSQANSFIYIEEDGLKDLIAHSKDFVLVIGQKGCETCEKIIKPNLINYINETHYLIYWIEYDNYNNVVANNNYSLEAGISSSTILFFDNGNISSKLEYAQSIYTSESNLFGKLNSRIASSNYNVVNTFVEYQYLNDFKMHTIDYSSTAYLDSLISSSSSLIEFSWQDCLDCSSLHTNFLDSYLIETNKTLNRFEVGTIRSSITKDEWKEWKAKYKLNNYGDGYVPSIIKYANNEYVSMAVYSNDTIEEIDGTYKVTNSFWGDKIIGTTGTSYVEAMENAKEKEVLLVKDYLDKNL